MSKQHIQQARDILLANNRGGYTVPSPKLYPFQWNWDSAFVALGLATFDRELAWQEIRSLMSGQWADGMVPHIVFHKDDPNYFPGPEVWQSGHQPPTSGISQPPILASMVCRMIYDSKASAEEVKIVAEIFEQIYAYNEWYHQQRDPYNTHLSAITHPWESGRDNSPDWDAALAKVPVEQELEYQRRDTQQVHSDQRPSDYQYDRYLSIVHYGRSCKWQQRQIYDHGPFLMLDPGVQFMLIRADLDVLQLLMLLQGHGYIPYSDPRVSMLEQRIVSSRVACEQQLWNRYVRAFCAKDLRTGDYSTAITSASMLYFYAAVGNEMQHAFSLEHTERILKRCNYAFPSLDPEHEQFELKRYWRGPSWPIMNYLLADAWHDQGQRAWAQRLRDDTCRLVERKGFYEYFNPIAADGFGGDQFSWTAAVYLLWNQ